MDRQELLKSIVDLSGSALLEEDRQIRLALLGRGGQGGLSRVQNERFQQYAIWKGLINSFDAEMERGGYCDIIITSEGKPHHIELKNWREETDGSQMHSIQRDIEKLSNRESGFLVLTSMNPPTATACNFRHLDRVLVGVNPSEKQIATFLTVGNRGEELESWVAGWPVPSRLQTNQRA